MMKYDIEKLKILAQLRQEVGLTQSEAAVRYFNLYSKRPQDAIIQWETGKSAPHQTRRKNFINYLLNGLKLRTTISLFELIWNQIMVDLWQWDPISDEENQNFLRGTIQTIPVRNSILLIPPPLSHKLVGRNKLLEEVRNQLINGGNIALYAFRGFPGIGKTTLMTEIAHDAFVRRRFTEGVLWVGLGQKPDLLKCLGEWGEVLGIDAGKLANTTDINERAKLIHRTIGNRRMLLLIDDVWDIQHAVTFRIGSECTYVITTRLPEIASQFAPEQTIEVKELDLDHGLALLFHLAPQIINEDIRIAEQIVNFLGGLPLGIVLVGNYLRIQKFKNSSISLNEMLNQLQNTNQLWELEQPSDPFSQHPSLSPSTSISLFAAIQISYQALGKKEKDVLNLLSLLPAKPNTFTEHLVFTLSGKSKDILISLVNSGLLEKVGGDRYTIHQTITNYISQKEKQRGINYSLLVNYYVNFAQIHERDHQVLETEISNILTAISIAKEQSLHNAYVLGSNALADYWHIRGFYDQADKFLQEAYYLAQQGGDAQGQALSLVNLSGLYIDKNEFTRSSSLASEGLKMARFISDSKLVCYSLTNLGVSAFQVGNYEEAENFYTEALRIAIEINHKARVTLLLTNLGLIAARKGNYDEAKAYYGEGLQLAKEQKNSPLESLVLVNLGKIYYEEGEFSVAISTFKSALQITQQLEYKERTCFILANLGQVLAYQHDFVEAKRYLLEGLELAQEINYQQLISIFFMNLGMVDSLQHHFSLAEQHFQRSLEVAKGINSHWLLNYILLERGESHLLQKKYNLAKNDFSIAFDLSQITKTKEQYAWSLFGLARIHQFFGNIDKALQLAQESLNLYQDLKHYKVKELTKWILTILNPKS